ncbi:MAG: hypothetical protein J5836_01505, partial [Clostridia bacterium]|nr:hypothetical protein [Clostridia bacterium]
ALTESWMFIFVKFYINDYNNKKYLNKKLKPLELSDLNFYKIIEYYESNIWDNQSRRMICVDGNPINVIDWLNKIRRYRNSIHIYKDKELGDKLELLEDTKVFYSIFKKITDALPEAQ